MRLFAKEEVNVGRQFEFDFAKAVCILGMVFVHCFEELPVVDAVYSSSIYYILVIILDAIFGAGTFMTCMGFGIAYSKNNNPKSIMKRGLTIFILGLVLNFVRYVIPYCLYFIGCEDIPALLYYLLCLFFVGDIMQFAGLALLLFGFLKFIKLPNIALFFIALAMSIVGSFVRFIEIESPLLTEFLGYFVGTYSLSDTEPAYASFPLLNWFIFVVLGYYLGRHYRKCTNIEKYYAIATPASGAIITIYLVLAIPNQFGMMSGNILDYYQMTTLDALVVFCGAIFAFGLYHYISKLFKDGAKNFIIGLSRNINKTYCIHWFFVGWLGAILWTFLEEGLESWLICLIALVIYIISSFLAEVYRKYQVKKKIKKGKLSLENAEQEYPE